jgi:hypothetical protein
MPKKKNKHIDTMAVDLFEREYRQEIEWQTEVLLGDGEFKESRLFKESEYDEAYERAVELVAEDKGITLL